MSKEMSDVPMTPAEVLDIAMDRAFSLGQTYWQQADSDSYKQNVKADATRWRFQELKAEALVAVAALVSVLQEAVDADGGTFYDGEDDDVGSRACCRVRSYKEHASDCWVAKAKKLLKGDGHE